MKYIAQLALFLYYKRIDLFHTDRIPESDPILFLPNHQNALMDPLVMAAYSTRKPFFLTRSDVFANSILRAFFGFLQMMPIYRMRDGRSKLSNNEAIFERCSEILLGGKSLVIFPEGNHNIHRRVRPLSKGFTRFLFRSLERDPGFNPALIPVGVNYQQAAGFPDSAVLYFGNAIYFQDVLVPGDEQLTIQKTKELLIEQLVQLTAHIGDEEQYDEILDRLERNKTDFTDPIAVNKLIASWQDLPESPYVKTPFLLKVWDIVFSSLNFPMIVLWRLGPKRLIPEIEFTATFRFLYSVVAYPLAYVLSYIVLNSVVSWEYALAFIFGHILHNLLYVKLR
ncbi:MAG: 1-acyl-sn-glycerol-3-phosphate acyltransferase [Bacteroidia bacterium]|nr:1-acyl-sn-glycerol-3-phosphate acyltransferase [Bacteroidia bacterium]